MTGYRFQLAPAQIRFADIDASGHLNHAAGLRFLEQARVLYYRDVMGLVIPDDLSGWSLVSLELAYRRAARFGEAIGVELRVPWVKRSSAGWAFRLFEAADNGTVLEGTGVHVHVGTDGGSAPIPDEIRRRIDEFENA